MEAWQNFFIAEVGASAALAGLIFVGASVNLNRILSVPGLPGRAFEALFILLVALVICSLLLLPGETSRAAGIEALLVGLTGWLTVLLLLRRGVIDEGRKIRSYTIARALLSQSATLPLIIGGVILLADRAGGVYWLAAAVIGALAAAVINGWVLLVEINR